MKLKTFKTNWPLCNPVNILSRLTKTEKAIKGKYQKIRTWFLAWKHDLYTPEFSYQETKNMANDHPSTASTAKETPVLY